MSTKSIDFALVLHNHQPVGNRDEIVEDVYRRSYGPFLNKLATYPEIRANLHYTGFLLDWIEEHHPEFIDLLSKLVARGQVEIIGGGYYEPVASVVPSADFIGQVDLLSKKIRQLFGVAPQGLWTAERAWEPSLPEVYSKSRGKYTLLDDDIFRGSGIEEEGFFRPYLTESRGCYLAVFPMLRSLRYLIPFKPVNQTIQFLRKRSLERHLAVYADDGEKFGAWPTTYEQVYDKGWLESFFRVIVKNREWLKTVKLSDYLAEHQPGQRIYLSSAAYPEMMEWSIPSTEAGRNTRGFWRLFMAKYPESARMYAKMLRVSRLANSLPSDSSRAALEELWKGECNDGYWHGVFGGLYAPILRRLTYSHLIGAQVLAEQALEKNHLFLRVERRTFDGRAEFQMDSRSLGVLLSPQLGGSVVELDYKPRRSNLLDTLARRPERYHRLIPEIIRARKGKGDGVRSIHEAPHAVEPGLEKLLIYDSRPRYSFVDHLLGPDASVDDFERNEQRELADLSGPFLASTSKRNGKLEAVLHKTANVAGAATIQMEKRIAVRSRRPSLDVKYTLRLAGSLPTLSALFAVELNLGSLGDRKFERANSRRKASGHTSSLTLEYPELGIVARMSLSQPSDIWQLPIKTVSQSEEGFESNLQCVAVVPNFEISLRKNEELDFALSLEIGDTG
jgi:4-alpha-glucanotransferase